MLSKALSDRMGDCNGIITIQAFLYVHAHLC